MSLKQEIETWVEALASYDNNEFEESLKSFDQISDTSKILFNCGVIHATLGEHDKAVECYQRSVALDKYLSVAYFQQGVSNFLVGDFEEALANFNDTLLYLRGNTYIDYEQLGLKFKLYSCEVLFNRGLCYIYLQQREAGMGDLSYAVKEKVTPDHDVIDDAIREEAEGYTVFSIPVGIVYRPNASKVKNLKTKDYLGKARLVASSDKANAFTGFAGSERRAVITIDNSKDDRPVDSISFAASNLVRNDIVSRSTRQQSAPPMNRNMFPPTPPPEGDSQQSARPSMSKSNTEPAGNGPVGSPNPAGSMTARANSVKNGPSGGSIRQLRRVRTDNFAPSVPEDDMISPGSSYPATAAFQERPRIGTSRTASEPRGPPARYQSMRSYRDGTPTTSRGRLFMEAAPKEREDGGADADIDEYPDELYDLYRNTAYSNPYTSGGGDGGNRRRASSRGRYGDDRTSDASNHSSMDEFEMLNGATPRRDMSRSRQTSRSVRERGYSNRGPSDGGYGGGSMSYDSRMGSGPDVDVRNIRVKLHHGDDTRYVMVPITLGYDGFLNKVQEKLSLGRRFSLKMQDEGDLITVGDGDDWEMSIMTAKKDALKKGEDMGRLEVWVAEK